MIKLVEIPCTKCGQPMHLPQHVADLPAHARLCAVCVRALLRIFEQHHVKGKVRIWQAMKAACQTPLFVPQAEQREAGSKSSS